MGPNYAKWLHFEKEKEKGVGPTQLDIGNICEDKECFGAFNLDF